MKQLIAALVMVSALGPVGWSQTALQQVSLVESTTPHPIGATAESLADIEEASARLAELNAIHERLMEAAGRMSGLYSALNERLGDVCDPNGQWGSLPPNARSVDLLCQTSVHETIEYLEIHSRMQRESRRFTTLSDFMKTHHDTAKSSIQNIR